MYRKGLGKLHLAIKRDFQNISNRHTSHLIHPRILFLLYAGDLGFESSWVNHIFAQDVISCLLLCIYF